MFRDVDLSSAGKWKRDIPDYVPATLGCDDKEVEDIINTTCSEALEFEEEEEVIEESHPRENEVSTREILDRFLIDTARELLRKFK